MSQFLLTVGRFMSQTNMSAILAVHGVGQQYKGDASIQSEWEPALLSGLHLAGESVAGAGQLTCAFYGHLFRQPGSLASSDTYRAEDVGPDEAELLNLMWQEAAKTEPRSVPPPGSDADTLARTPQLVQRALSALSRSSFFANIAQSALIGDVKQAVRYLNDPDLREKVLETVVKMIKPETRIVIGHSLGSIVAYEALCANPANVRSFLSIGSPLGIRHIIFHKLTPRPNREGVGAWPGMVKYWTNIADAGDIVALEKRLGLFFGPNVRDILVYNGSDAHSGQRYLTTREAGAAIAEGLR
jgi:hypothetical protein